MTDDSNRLDAIVDELTDDEQTDLFRAIDGWQTARNMPDALDGLRRALEREAGHGNLAPHLSRRYEFIVVRA